MFHFISHLAVFIGYLTTICLIAYLVLFVLSIIRKDEVKNASAFITSDNMPILRPTPIPTASQQTPVDRLIAWIFSVRKWQVIKAFEYKDKTSNVTYVIPAGFEFDGASIPRFLWAILSPVGLLLIPGLLHDFGYKYDGIYIKKEGSDEPEWSTDISGKDAWDKLFQNVGDDINGIHTLNAIAAFGLYIGGFAAWNNWRDQKEPKPDMKWSIYKESDTSSSSVTSAHKEASSNNEQSKPVVKDISSNNEQQKQTAKDTSAKPNTSNTKLEEVANTTSTKSASTKSKVIAKKVPAKKPKTKTPSQASKKNKLAYELVSGTTKTTKVGVINENQQRVLGKIVTKDDSFKNVYKLECDNCKNVYGVKSTSVNKAKCPSCQEGKPGVDTP